MNTVSTIDSTPERDYLPSKPIIIIPFRNHQNRLPSYYPDIDSKIKKEHNIAILHSCKLLKSFSNNEGICAMILDGREMRTTKELLYLGNKLKRLDIVEYNLQTYDEIKRKSINFKNINVFHSHIYDFVKNCSSSEVNVVYFDVISNYFSSENSNGTDKIISAFLKKSTVNEIILAATFCLRSSHSRDFETQKKNISNSLQKIFFENNFDYNPLIADETYRGQRTSNRSMMFVIYFLTKNEKK